MQSFEEVRQHTLNICSRLEPEDHVVQPWPFVSPPKWHLGHSTWFFETFCLEPFFTIDPFDSNFKFIFNSYYESQGAHIAQDRRGTLSRPSLKRVLEYRKTIDSRIAEAQSSMSHLTPEQRYSWHANLELGLQHEQQHQELLMMDIKAILWHQPGRPAYSADAPGTNSASYRSGWMDFPEGLYEVGAQNSGFSYDNERPRHKVYLEDFQICDGLVTNAEYLEFIDDNGYSRPELWLSDGWAWIKENAVYHPLYWRQTENGWMEYGLHGEVDLILSDPVVHVSYYEADAFARWRESRLPTELEWETAFRGQETHALWQWTASSYLPYPGFKSFDRGFAEYNSKFMSNQMVLRGGCWCTPKKHYRPSYRNFFQPEMRWQFSGIRLAK